MMSLVSAFDSMSGRGLYKTNHSGGFRDQGVEFSIVKLQMYGETWSPFTIGVSTMVSMFFVEKFWSELRSRRVFMDR